MWVWSLLRMVASAKGCFVLLCCNRHLSAARAEMFSKFVCQGMEAHVLHGMNLFHVWKFREEPA